MEDKNEKHKIFEPYQRVLARNRDTGVWTAKIYSHWSEDAKCHYVSGWKCKDENVVPYDGNESLLGTTTKPVEVVTLDVGMPVMAKTDNGNWVYATYLDCNELPWNNITVKMTNGQEISVNRIVPFNKFVPIFMGRGDIIVCESGTLIKEKI